MSLPRSNDSGGSRRPNTFRSTGRRRVGKTFLIERFATGRRHVFFPLLDFAAGGKQLPLLGDALAVLADDPVLRAQPPSTWPAVFALIERLAASQRLLLAVTRSHTRAARDESLPSVLQNWWDDAGATWILVLLLCGSAVQMMERLFSGEAPLAGCVTGRLTLGPFDVPVAAELLAFPVRSTGSPPTASWAGVPLYLHTSTLSTRTGRSLSAVISPTARLYVEPELCSPPTTNLPSPLRPSLSCGPLPTGPIVGMPSSSAASPLRVVRTCDGTAHRQSGAGRTDATGHRTHAEQTYRTRSGLTDNFFLFWFRFVEPAQGAIEFGGGARVVAGIIPLCQIIWACPSRRCAATGWPARGSAHPSESTKSAPGGRQPSAGCGRPRRNWQVALAGECKWRNEGFAWGDLETYLGRVTGVGLRPGAAGYISRPV